MMRLFEDTDLAELSSWSVAHGGPVLDRDALPAIGLIEPGVAAMFLVQTDSTVAFVHHEMTNPEAPLRARHAAVMTMQAEIQRIAKTKGYRHLLTWASGGGAVRRAIRAGGTVIDRAVVVIAKQI